MWLLRLGLYELTRPKPKADDWVLIFDHTVQLGGMKALIIVGIRLSQWERATRPAAPRGLDRAGRDAHAAFQRRQRWRPGWKWLPNRSATRGRSSAMAVRT